MSTPRTFRFRPRYRGLAFTALGLGGTLGAVAVAVLGSALVPLATGLTGVALGVGYLASPAWRLEVVVDDDALEVRGPKGSRFRVLWTDVVEVVIVSRDTHVCFVDGGAPDKSLIVPGDGLPAPYDLADKAELFAAILAHVPADKVRTKSAVVG